MKWSLLFVLCALALGAGCSKAGNHPKPAPGEGKTFSSDGYSVHVGAVKMNGTNVPLDQVQVTFTTNASPSTNTPPSGK